MPQRVVLSVYAGKEVGALLSELQVCPLTHADAAWYLLHGLIKGQNMF